MSFFGHALYGFFIIILLVFILFPTVNYIAIGKSLFFKNKIGSRKKSKLFLIALSPSLFCVLPYLVISVLGEFLSNSIRDDIMVSSIVFIILAGFISIFSFVFLVYYFIKTTIITYK